MKSIHKIRERINIKLFESKTQVLLIVRLLHIFVALSSIAAMIYYYGFPRTDFSHKIFFNIIQTSFTFYVVRFFIKILYHFHPLQFIKSHWLEGLTVLFLIVEGLNNIIFGRLLLPQLFVSMGFDSFEGFSTLFIQTYFFVLLLLELRTSDKLITKIKVQPVQLFTLSIVFMSLLGAGLLMMPNMSTIEGGIRFIDALFLSISAYSTTGLSTLDAALDLTFKGQLVLMFLIKIGGLNIISFGALFILMSRFGVGVKHNELVDDFMNSSNSYIGASSLLVKIVVWATTIEVVGMILIYIGLGNEGIFANEKLRIFSAMFHSFSAFNNAGYSVIQGGMMHPDIINNYFVHTVMMTLVFLGGFGMVYLFDLFGLSRLRERMRNPWKTIEFGTKISLYFTIVLLLLGAIVFFIYEYNNTLINENIFVKILSSFYHSMITRNAGFNTIDISALSMPVLIVFLFLMFVGASSGSAGGGIRTSTFAIMWAAMVSNMRGKKNTELFKRTISNDLVLKAYVVFLFFIVINIIGSFILSISEQKMIHSGEITFMDLVFEHVSAASTVGLSTGITAKLTDVGKYTLIWAMFVGRVGTLTLAYLIGKRVISTNYKYPTANTMVG
ncbi:MAG: TrkH family potassium uptake protein [Bacteroidia bacterium]